MACSHDASKGSEARKIIKGTLMTKRPFKSDFVDSCVTGKCNRMGAHVLQNGRIIGSPDCFGMNRANFDYLAVTNQ